MVRIGCNAVAIAILWTWASDTSMYNSGHTTDAELISAISDIHDRGMCVMIKLHITPGLAPSKQPLDINAFFATYAAFVNHYAVIAQANGVEFLCIGNEMNVVDDANYSLWSALIQGVRKLYGGPLTLNSTPQDYQTVPFWNLLDYISISAYFALSPTTSPSVAELVNAWSNYQGSNYLNDIETLQASVNKPLMFTEVGYQSVDYAASRFTLPAPNYNGVAQANCYEALLQVFESQPWFAGVFFWEWWPVPYGVGYGGYGDTGWTPQNKAAQDFLLLHWNPPQLDEMETDEIISTYDTTQDITAPIGWDVRS
jgi:hypothetical protein